MENVKRRKPLKPKNRFTLCCFCLGSTKSDVELNVPYERRESYDYVVEKLAIKRVPISLFATEEDLEEIENATSLSSLSSNTTDFKATPKDKKSATIFSNYYSMIPRMIPKNNTPTNVRKNLNKLRNGDTRTGNEKRKNFPISNLPIPKSKNIPNNIPLDLIAKVHKNITKNVSVTKDNPINISPNIVKQANKQANVLYEKKSKEIVKADVHKEHLELKNTIKMTPQLQETLNALGSKKRPDGSPSINHRTINRLIVNETHSSNFDGKNILQLKADIPSNSEQGNIAQDVLHKENDRNSLENSKSTYIDNSELISLDATTSKGQSQKWKIIIKEHDDSSKSSDVDSTDYTTDSEFDEKYL